MSDVGNGTRLQLRLYVTGQTPRSEKAMTNLRRIMEAEGLADGYDLEVVDVLERPELAEQERIMATPTLVRRVPPPIRRVIGDLSDWELVVLGLDLNKIREGSDD